MRPPSGSLLQADGTVVARTTGPYLAASGKCQAPPAERSGLQTFKAMAPKPDIQMAYKNGSGDGLPLSIWHPGLSAAVRGAIAKGTGHSWFPHGPTETCRSARDEKVRFSRPRQAESGREQLQGSSSFVPTALEMDDPCAPRVHRQPKWVKSATEWRAADTLQWSEASRARMAIESPVAPIIHWAD